jgi:hypothetical protein
MSLADIAAEIDEYYRAQVYADTWGHLAPEPGRWYRGEVLFAHSVYSGDGSVPVDTHFEDLTSSPWFYEGLGEFIDAHRTDQGPDAEGGVYQWTGMYALRITPRIQNDDGDIIREGGHEHVWVGEFRTLIPPRSLEPKQSGS